MTERFSSCELVEMGLLIERNGYDFYCAVVAMVEDESVKKVFQYLANAETKHIEFFNGLLSATCDFTVQEIYPDEYFAYMKALADEHIFTQRNKGSEIAKEVSSAAQAIDIGLKFEKDSIAFYEGMKKMVPESEQKLVDTIVQEEQMHYDSLHTLKQDISSAKGE